jgi:hypothetical protein
VKLVTSSSVPVTTRELILGLAPATAAPAAASNDGERILFQGAGTGSIEGASFRFFLGLLAFHMVEVKNLMASSRTKKNFDKLRTILKAGFLQMLWRDLFDSFTVQSILPHSRLLKMALSRESSNMKVTSALPFTVLKAFTSPCFIISTI